MKKVLFVKCLFLVSLLFLSILYCSQLASNGSEQIVDSYSHNKSFDSLIYFWDSSGRDTLTIRQSCSVESAARQNPNSLVRIYMSTTIVNETSPSIKLLKELPNVEISPVDLESYFNNTPLAKWYADGAWKNSPYKVSHMSDYLRVLASYKHGGLYLDTDFIILRSLENLRNFAAHENPANVTGAAFHFDRGHPVVQRMVDYLAEHYEPQSWVANGPAIFHRFVKENCGNKNTTDPKFQTKCGPGVNMLGTNPFYPFYYTMWRIMFQNNTSDQLPRELDEAYGVHMWNKLSCNETVFVGSNQYYALLAARFCPLSFAAAVHKF